MAFPSVNFAGIKLREYPPEGQQKANKLNLEFKLRDHDFCVVTLAEGILGLMERWRKWTVPVDMGADSYIQATGGTWSYVEKSRKLVTFAVKDGSVELPREKGRLDQGCGLELTNLKAGDVTALITGRGERWWSLCFEAFSDLDGADIAMVLRQTADHVFETCGVPSFNTDRSFSYPEWLAQISRNV